MSLTEPSQITSDLLDAPRKVWVQRPISEKASVCLIFLDAEIYINRVKAPQILHDLQITNRLPPLASIYLSNLDAAARHLDFTCNETYSLFVATDLCLWIERTLGSYKRLYLCGLSLSGLAALFTAIRHPTVLSGVLSQSPSAWWNDERLAQSLTMTGTQSAHFWISVGNDELQEGVAHPPSGLFQKTSQLHSVRRLAQILAGSCDHIHYNEFSGGHDPACWARELPQALVWLIKST